MEIEEKFNKSISEVCLEYKLEKIIKKEDYILPRIETCENLEQDEKNKLYYYYVQFHELGHHYSMMNTDESKSFLKTLPNNFDDEKVANACAMMLIKKHLPLYFFFFFDFAFYFENLGVVLSKKEKFIGYVQFLKYLLFEKK